MDFAPSAEMDFTKQIICAILVIAVALPAQIYRIA